MRIPVLLVFTALVLMVPVATGGCFMSGQRMTEAEIEEDGGIRDHSNPDAPKTIRSREIVALNVNFRLWDESDGQESRAYALDIRREGDVFLLTASGGTKGTVQVDASFPDKVQQIIEKHGLTRLNGINRTTSGLPVEFSPCTLTVDYASGERLYFRIDNDPDAEWAEDMRELFLHAPAGGM